MKMFFSLWVFALLFLNGNAQKDSQDHLVPSDLMKPKTDTALYALWYRAENLALNAPDSSLMYAQEGLVFSKQMKLPEYEGLYLLTIAKVFRNIGNYPKALETAFQSLSIFEHGNIQSDILINLYFIGQIFNLQGDPIQSLSYNFRAKTLAEKLGENGDLIRVLSYISRSYEQLNRLDSALLYAKQSYARCNPDSDIYVIGGCANLIGEIYSKLGNPKAAMDFYRLGVSYSRNIRPYSRKMKVYTGNFKDFFAMSDAYLGIAEIYKKENKTDSCLYYSKLSLALAQNGKFQLLVMKAGKFLTDYYEDKKIFDSAFAYQQLSINAKDSMFSAQKIIQFQNISFSEQMRQQEIKEAEIRYRNKVGVYILFAVVAVFLFVAIILWRNNRQKQKANLLLNKQKGEIEFQKTKAEVAFDELKSTQAQLVQSEKMASLGELTAGIAHEIQNPLNFVNNFSELNAELIAEMKNEIDKGNYDDVKAIADDIAENEQKIKQHGKRADAIVKGMLQHSRSSSGKKEPTNINALADEYLRLAYHGLRAKDKSFNALMETDYDKHIGNIDIIPQDIGRVILNLITNAFYAVTEKKKASQSASDGGVQYEPTVTVSTKLNKAPSGVGANQVSISVKDNGNGIPKKIFDKIFQPFFTTKPTGQGTGLGLSLSYDIIKAHGGEIKVETKEGEGTTFIIQLPVV